MSERTAGTPSVFRAFFLDGAVRLWETRWSAASEEESSPEGVHTVSDWGLIVTGVLFALGLGILIPRMSKYEVIPTA